MGSNTFDLCRSHCEEKGSRYMAIQDGSQCFCGDTYSTSTEFPKVSDGECSGKNPECSMQNGCGRSWRQAIFKLHRHCYAASSDQPGIDDEYCELNCNHDPPFCPSPCQCGVTTTSTTQAFLPRWDASNCFHLTKQAGLSADMQGMEVPVGRKLVSYKGETLFVPLQRVDVQVGISVWVYNEPDDTLEVYWAASSMNNMLSPDLPGSNPADFFISPADGMNMPVPPEGRIQPFQPHPLGFAIYHATHRIPVDYGFLYRDERKTCPPEVFQRLSEKANGLDMLAFAAKGDNVSLLEQITYVVHFVEVLECGLAFLRGSTQFGNGFELMEATVWAHFLMEAPTQERMRLVNGWEE